MNDKPKLSRELMQRMTRTQPHTISATGVTRSVDGFSVRRRRDNNAARRHIGQYAQSRIGGCHLARPGMEINYRGRTNQAQTPPPEAPPRPVQPGSNRPLSALPPSRQTRGYDPYSV